MSLEEDTTNIYNIKNHKTMKKLILSIAVLFTASCSEKNEPNFCYTCVQTMKTTVSIPTPGYPQIITTTFESCDGDKSGQTTATASQGGITATTVTTTTCVRK